MSSNTQANDWAATLARNTVRLGFWGAAWAGTLALATFGPTFLWSGETLSFVAVLLNLAVGFGMILAYKRYLKGLDEMQQKIELEALGLAIGIGVVVGLALDIGSDPEIGFLVMLMSLVYLAAVIAGHWRYR